MSSSSDSGFSDCDEDYMDYWQEVDRMSEHFKQLAQQETKYIFEHQFEIPKCQKYQIITGFSAARGFMSAVRLQHMHSNPTPSDKTDHISFTMEEWREFITYLKQLMTHLQQYDNDDNDDYTGISFEIDYIKISSATCLDLKMIKVDNSVHVFYISELVAREIVDLHEKVINTHLCLVFKLDFETFYHHFLESANDLLCNYNYELNPLDVLLNLCSDDIMLNLDLFNFMQMYCIRDCLFYNRDKVLNDLDRKMYLRNS